MNPWQWIEDFELEAYRTDDFERLSLTNTYFRAHDLSHDLPEQRLALFEQGREMALRLKEPWWALYFEHWAIETLLFGLQRPQQALDRVARAVVESRKPIYDAFPQRSDLYLNLVGAYLSVDPIGFEEKLRPALAHVEVECGTHPFKRAYVAQLKGYFLEAIGDPESVAVAWDYLQLAEEAQSEHFQWDALGLLCSTLYRFNPEMAHDQIGDIAQFGEEVARREERNRGVAAFLMWRAVAARWDGDEATAAALYFRASELQKRVPPPRNDIHFPAIAFHLAGGEGKAALGACQDSIRVLRRHKLTFLEAQRRLEKCRLLSDLERDWSREARRLLKVSSGLASKDHWRQQVALMGGNIDD
jgi:hypothetical protein